ncbi:MAG: 2-phospho-L-lactate guanylyltransferase [Acidobacteria bacterium 13_2_20CM_57_17]|nr:MAG: 2-phospho-L-lactate guanylyltransferase [Acidobacteria bacterium 13_2_20CM_57_17]
MRALLLPVKDLRNAKKRLIGVLTPEERFSLAETMLADTVRAVQGVRRIEKVFVITNYAPAMQLAEENGWEILREEQQISESHSVDAASKLCEQNGVSGLLRLPLDLPLIQSSDIDELLALKCRAPSLVIVPSRDGTGTNAILRTPPTLFPSHFGTGSFAKHLAEAESSHAQVIVRRNARLEMDVDGEPDLRALLENDLSATETGRWLHASGVAARFPPNMQAGAAVAR